MTETADDPETTSHLRLILPAYRALHLPRRKVASLAVLAFISGLGTTAALVLLIQVGLRVTGNADGSIGMVGLNLDSLSVGTTFFAAVAAAGAVLVVDLLAARSAATIVAAVQLKLRKDLFDAYSAADWVTRTADRPGHLQDVVATNVTRALNLTNFINTGIVALLTLATMVTSAFLISPVVTGAMLLCIGLIVALLTPLAGRIRTASEATRLANHDYAMALAEITAVPTEISTFGVTASVREEHEAASRKLASRHARLTRLERAIPATQRNLALLGVLGTLALVYQMGLAGVGELGAVVVLLGRSLSYTQAIQQTINRFASAGPFVLALADEGERYQAAANSTNPTVIEMSGLVDGSIDLHGVSYTHPGGAVATLHSVSCHISHGDFVAVVGPSGSGKSTLAEILLRLRTPDAGQFLVSGTDATTFSDEAWASTVAYVPQTPALITGTVADNVRFHRPGITDTTVDEALESAGLLEDTVLLPSGRNTLLGTGVRTLSGGQLQRLAIARALAGSPRIVVLDEPTSALDAASELAIHNTLISLSGHTTVVVIAHRASIVHGCDRLIAMSAGRVAAEGTPEMVAASKTATASDFALAVMTGH